MGSMTYHLVVRTLGGKSLLTERSHCAWVWRNLRRVFPEAWICVIMPDHIHLVCDSDDPAELLWKFSTVLRGLSTHMGKGAVWERVPNPEPVRNYSHFLRTFRYVVLNPCRDRLCSDPLEWEWSSYRDLFGAVVDPWITWSRLEGVLRRSSVKSLVALHEWISGDPSVEVTGTAAPKVSSVANEAAFFDLMHRSGFRSGSSTFSLLQIAEWAPIVRRKGKKFAH